MMEENSSSPAHRSDVGNSNSTENGSTMEKKGVPDIIPMQDYNIKKAKLKSSLKWMVARAYDQYDPPPDLKDPFFRDADGEDHLKPSVIYQLASSELYSMACTNVFPPTGQQWQGHWSIIQGLSRKGVYVVDEKEQPVTETTLAQTQRIKLTAHLAMMDAIQQAYVTDVVSIEKVVQAVRQIASFSASSELPFDREDALLFWINKVCSTVNHQMVKERKGQPEGLMQSSPQKVRLRREQLKPLPSIPVMDDIMKDLGDGCCLSVLLHYYCPHLVSLDDLSLQDPMSFAESIHNLNIIEEFCQTYLPTLYPFKAEDLLYSPTCLRANLVAMLAEVFHTFETLKPEHLSVDKEQAPKISIVSNSISAKLPPLPISSATKKSFHNDLTSNLVKNEMRNASSNPELNKIGTSSPAGQAPLLARRQKQVQSSFHLDDDSLQSQLRRATSLDNMEVGKRSFVAWQKPSDPRQDGGLISTQSSAAPTDRSSLRDSNASSLLTNVSLDSELDRSMNIDEFGMLTRSQNNDQSNNNQELAAPPSVESRPETYTMSSSEYADEDDLEVESLTSALSRVSRVSENVQPSQGAGNSLEGPPPPAVAGGLNGHQQQQAQLNGAVHARQSQNEEMIRTEAASVQSVGPSAMASYASDSSSKSGNPFTFGSEQSDTSNNRRKLTLDIQPVPMDQSRDSGRQQEKLMPAVLRPLKEKSHSANKQDERGVLGRSPRHAIDQGAKTASWGSGQRRPISNDDMSPETPLSPDTESIADSLASDFSMRSNNGGNPQKGQFRVPFQPLNQNVSQQPPQMTKGRHGEEFYFHSDPSSHSAPQHQGGSMHDSMQGSAQPKPASSFTVMDKPYTLETAQQAGIPIVSSMEADMHRSLQHSQQQMMDSGGRGGSPRLSQSQHSNAYPHSYPHANPSHHPNPQHSYSDPHANPNHSSPMHHPHMQHSYSPSHSHHVPSHQTPPPPPPRYGSPHYPNPQHHDPHHHPDPHHNPAPHHHNPHYADHHHANPQHANPHHPQHANPHQPYHHPNDVHRSSPQYSPSPHASNPQPVFHGQFQSNPQYTGGSGGGSSGAGQPELTRFGKPGLGTAPSSDHQRDNREPLQVGLTQVRLRLEEKRRNMEKEKRHLERHWTKQRQRVGKAAFMQVLAIQKRAKENDIVAGNVSPEGTLSRGGNKPYSKEEIERSLQDAQSRWLQEGNNQPGKTTFAALNAGKSSSSGGSTLSRDSDSPRTHSESPVSVREVGGRGSPGSSSGSHSPPQMTPDQYNTSMDKMNDNMSKLMKEIQKLTLQQEQLKSAVESPRQKTESDRQTPVSEPEHSGFVLHGPPPQSPGSQSFYLGKPASPQSEPDNEPFVLQENPLFSLSSDQLSTPSSTSPVSAVQSPKGQQPITEAHSPKDNYKTYHVPKPKTRPKLDIDLESVDDNKTESLADKRGQQVTPLETKNIVRSLGSDAPLSTDDLDRSPGFRLHGLNDDNDDDTSKDDTPVVQVGTYRKPVGFEIVDDSTPTPKTSRKEPPPLSSPFRPPTQPQQQAKSERTPRIRRTSSGSSGSSPTKKRPPSVYEIVGETESDQAAELDPAELMVVKPLDESGQDVVDDSGDSKVLGFVIEQTKSEEDEIAKRREQFLRSRLRKQEEEKAKKANREAQAEKLKEQQRIKQDELEAKKAKEVERREKIRIAYQKKKAQAQDEHNSGPAVPKRVVKKTRPRSRIIVDDTTDYAKPTISSGPPAVSAQDIENANLVMRQQKSSFTISNGQPDRNGGGAASSVSSASGPKLYVKPASKSNRHIITNAIAHVVLAGTVNKNTKDTVLLEVARSEYKHFVILFRNQGLQFRGMYGYCPDSDEITKFHGTGPRHITPKMIESLYKYNSGDKSFSRIPSKSMSVQIDAVTIANHLWQAKKPSAKKH